MNVCFKVWIIGTELSSVLCKFLEVWIDQLFPASCATMTHLTLQASMLYCWRTDWNYILVVSLRGGKNRPRLPSWVTNKAMVHSMLYVKEGLKNPSENNSTAFIKLDDTNIYTELLYRFMLLLFFRVFLRTNLAIKSGNRARFSCK